ncbi:hypothetical protein PPERSA_02877 [Pseudocohnilembus persalinus]|uniref:RING-type domain-containing protein n=1 Tax=Pseudocohnilembus persalinus TaxID=266149 RepID=A0A0V0QN15_PSEPJ|nr:hypothetical protein PPERSA_02877 [Pseudocohnilembus persalinus]|eukprot:KRX03498.1 hypothetical protein PPERSA_02877 [Pseudocohnilembus persalinus]
MYYLQILNNQQKNKFLVNQIFFIQMNNYDEAEQRRQKQKEKWGNWMKQREMEKQLQDLDINLDQAEQNNNQQNNDNKNILNDLTMKIFERYQKELDQKRGGKNNSKNKSNYEIEKKISQEVESNTCPICLELMIPPNNSPILLFPCGHTFCRNCIFERNGKKMKLSKCGICRQKVTSSAVNFSLQNLICTYTNNKHLLEEYDKNNQKEQEFQQNNDEKDEQKQNFQEQYDLYNMRVRILQEEKNQIMDQIIEEKNRAKSQQKLCNTFKEQKEQVIKKIKQMQEELQLIEQFHDENFEKLQQYQKNVRENEYKLDVIDETLQPLQREKDKYFVLKQSDQHNQ